MPCSPTPVGPTCQAIRHRRRGPRYVHDEGSRDKPYLEAQSHGFSTRCLRFVVWVSPALHARLASRCGPHATGRDWLPAGFLRKVSDQCHPPFPSFLAQGHSRFFFEKQGTRFRVHFGIPHRTPAEARNVIGIQQFLPKTPSPASQICTLPKRSRNAPIPLS